MRIIFFLCASSCFSLPTNPSFVHGEGEVTSLRTAEQIVRATDRSVIHWESFDLAQEESIYFDLPAACSAVLNRVLSTKASAIHGSIASNGQVLLLNPAGILVGKEAVIDVGGWIASTLDVQDRNFIESRDWQFSGSSSSPIDIAGVLRADRIAILAEEIFCSGDLSGEKISLIASRSASLFERGEQTFSSPGHLDFSGNAKAASISLLGDAVSLSGELSAFSIFVGGSREGKDPMIWSASSVEVSPFARVETSAGGQAIFFSQGSLDFRGNVGIVA
jgi:filamentous hemagglutinin family protein